MDKKIVEYEIVEATSQELLKKNIKRKLKEGFQPFESLVVIRGEFSFNYFQAMVKYAS